MRSQKPALLETRLRDNVWVFTFGGESLSTSYGANCIAVVGRDSALLIDPFIAPEPARRAAEALADRTSRPLRYVVLTHHHTDHALGAGIFAAAGVEVIAHRACVERMATEHADLITARRRQPDLAELFSEAEPYRPSRLIEGSATLDLGGTRAILHHPGHHHTPGDVVVHLPEESVVVCGDLVSHGFHVNYEDAEVTSLGRGLETLRAFGADLFVPGHGSPAGAELLDAQARYHASVSRTVCSAPDSREAIRQIRSDFPGYKLEEVIPSAIGKPWLRGY